MLSRLGLRLYEGPAHPPPRDSPTGGGREASPWTFWPLPDLVKDLEARSQTLSRSLEDSKSNLTEKQLIDVYTEIGRTVTNMQKVQVDIWEERMRVGGCMSSLAEKTLNSIADAKIKFTNERYRLDEGHDLTGRMKSDIVHDEYNRNEVRRAFKNKLGNLSESQIKSWYNFSDTGSGDRDRNRVWKELEKSDIEVSARGGDSSASSFDCRFGPRGEGRQSVTVNNISFTDPEIRKFLTRRSDSLIETGIHA